jgi:hypothetical protein
MKPMRAGYEHRPITAAFRSKCHVCGGEILKGHKITRPDDKTPFRHACDQVRSPELAQEKRRAAGGGDSINNLVPRPTKQFEAA